MGSITMSYQQSFLENHKEHRIVFGLKVEAVARMDDEMFDWMEVGY
jgi:hypothetical protein